MNYTSGVIKNENDFFGHKSIRYVAYEAAKRMSSQFKKTKKPESKCPTHLPAVSDASTVSGISGLKDYRISPTSAMLTAERAEKIISPQFKSKGKSLYTVPRIA